MVKLDELTVGLGALVGRHHPGRRLAARRQSSAGGTMPQVIEVGDKPMRPQPVGAAADLELEHAELDADLQDHAAVAGANLARQVLAGLRIIRPSLDHVIQVPTHHSLPTRRSEKVAAASPASARRVSTATCLSSLVRSPSPVNFTDASLLIIASAQAEPTRRSRGTSQETAACSSRQHQSRSRSVPHMILGSRRLHRESIPRIGYAARVAQAASRDGLANRQAFVIIELLPLPAFPALLAQLAEQLTLNQRVVGSSPTGGISDRRRLKPARSVKPLIFQGFFRCPQQPHPIGLSRQYRQSPDSIRPLRWRK